MKKKNQKAKILCLLLAMVMVLLTGCGGQSGSNKSQAGAENSEEGNAGKNAEGSGEKQSENIAMGRYVESETDLTKQLEAPTDITKLTDGRLLITDKYMDFQVSADGGLSWKALSYDWQTKMQKENTYIFDIDAASDGTIGVVYECGTKEDEQAGVLKSRCLLVYPDGTQVEIDVPVTEEEGFIRSIYLTDNGRYFATTGTDIYELFADGTGKKFLTLDFYCDFMQFAGNLMIMDGYPREGTPVFYDMEKKEYVEDEVLADFVEKYYKERESYNGGEWVDLYFFGGEEDVIYLAGKKGLHRHVIGGTSMEQVVDGSLSRMSNPSYGLVGMIMLEKDEFLALFSGGRVVRYTYDPNMPSVPSDSLKVYSLKENDTLQQAISVYQLQNPDVYVQYELGIEKGDAVTEEDALKKLNTKIMAGEGPDLLLLDGLPIDSYREKGLLLELSSIWEEMKSQTPMFENIAEALRTADGLYMLPGSLSLPLVEGKPKYVDKMTDLAGTAAVFKELRKENPKKALIDRRSGKEIMKMFSIVSEPDWKTSQGELDRDALEEFLIFTKEIYDAQTQGLDAQISEVMEQSKERFEKDYGEDYFYNILFYGINELTYIGGEQQLAAGVLNYPYGYYGLCSVQKVTGFEEDKILPMRGQGRGVFVPEDMLGICATSANTEKAADFMKLYLGTEFQESRGEFSINKEAFDKMFIPNPDYLGENGYYGTTTISNDSGFSVSLDIYTASDKQLAELKGFFEAADTPYIENRVLEKAVFANGDAYMRGEQNLEEALNSIEQEMEIYLAE